MNITFCSNLIKFLLTRAHLMSYLIRLNSFLIKNLFPAALKIHCTQVIMTFSRKKTGEREENIFCEKKTKLSLEVTQINSNRLIQLNSEGNHSTCCITSHLV